MAIPTYTYLTKMFKLLYLQEQVQENKNSDFNNKINCLVRRNLPGKCLPFEYTTIPIFYKPVFVLVVVIFVRIVDLFVRHCRGLCVRLLSARCAQCCAYKKETVMDRQETPRATLYGAPATDVLFSTLFSTS